MSVANEYLINVKYHIYSIYHPFFQLAYTADIGLILQLSSEQYLSLNSVSEFNKLSEPELSYRPGHVCQNTNKSYYTTLGKRV